MTYTPIVESSVFQKPFKLIAKMKQPEWIEAPEWANWLAMDYDEQWFWFEKKPHFRNGIWFSSNKIKTATERGKSQYPDLLTCSQTLEKRPAK